MTGAGGSADLAGHRLELSVDALAVGGDGVAREPSGRVVFVPRTAPGDRVQVLVTEDRGSFLRARTEHLLDPGVGRRAPPCPYYGECGGCQLQHLRPGAQRDAKRHAVRDTLHRIGGLDARVPPVRELGPALGYRNRVSLTLRRQGAGEVTAGYHAVGDPGRIVDLADCPLAEPAVGEAWRGLRRTWGPGARRLPAGAELRLTLRASAHGGTALLVEGGRASEPGEPGRLARSVPGLTTYAWKPDRGKLRVLWGERVLPEAWQGFELGLTPGAFVQVNRRASEAIERALDAGLGPVEGMRILDLYAGVGSRALRWSLRGADVEACETQASAVAAGREAASRYGAPARLRTGRVEETLGDLLPADAVVVNPPRAGLSKTVARALRQRGRARRLAYVSCDPATLARDLARLSGTWSLTGLEAFDAFPQTAHVETLAWLEAVEEA